LVGSVNGENAVYQSFAASLGITIDEFKRREAAGEFKGKSLERKGLVPPVLAEEAEIEPARLVGMERVGQIAARALNGNGHPQPERSA
jgi:hypothetical protein